MARLVFVQLDLGALRQRLRYQKSWLRHGLLLPSRAAEGKHSA
jgi:hypothetical protein